MVKMALGMETYASAETGNVRYPSTAREAENGWAYVLSKDKRYVRELAHHNHVEVRHDDGGWSKFHGEFPSGWEDWGSGAFRDAPPGMQWDDPEAENYEPT